jgi:hypothetical protein
MKALRAEWSPHPMLVGVTGHRDIPTEYVLELERRVELLLTQLSEQYPHRRVVVLSSLAEGADRLCAHAALAAGCSL